MEKKRKDHQSRQKQQRGNKVKSDHRQLSGCSESNQDGNAGSQYTGPRRLKKTERYPKDAVR